MFGTITFLVDNVAEEPFIAEHGFSLLLETGGKRILFDTGQADALFYNAKELNVPLTDLDMLILSHGHYDHGGNVAKIIELNPLIQFFAHPDCLISRWSIPVKANPPNPIGLDQQDKEAIRNLPEDHCHWCEQPVEIMADVWITGAIPRLNPFEDVGGSFYTDEQGRTPDLIRDDMALWLGGESTTVICGCCHSGIKNTLDHIISFTGVPQIKTLIGGFHLFMADEERLLQTVSTINDTTVQDVYPAHCTGEPAIVVLQEQLQARMQRGKVGLKIRM